MRHLSQRMLRVPFRGSPFPSQSSKEMRVFPGVCGWRMIHLSPPLPAPPPPFSVWISENRRDSRASSQMNRSVLLAQNCARIKERRIGFYIFDTSRTTLLARSTIRPGKKVISKKRSSLRASVTSIRRGLSISSLISQWVFSHSGLMPACLPASLCLRLSLFISN